MDTKQIQDITNEDKVLIDGDFYNIEYVWIPTGKPYGIIKTVCGMTYKAPRTSTLFVK